jgi:hypothetical protein
VKFGSRVLIVPEINSLALLFNMMIDSRDNSRKSWDRS